MWARWREGDRAAGAVLLGHYDDAIGAAMTRFGVRTDDEREEVYAELVLNLARYKDQKDLEKSFFGLARKMLLSITLRLREHQQRQQAASETLERLEDPDAGSREPLALREAIEHCLTNLKKPFERELFRQRFLEDHDVQELSRRHGKSANHISVLVYRATKQMRECLSGQGFTA